MQLVVIDPVTKIQGDAAVAIRDWLNAKPHLLAASPGGPPTRGAAPGAAPVRDPLEGVPVGAAQLAVAMRQHRR